MRASVLTLALILALPAWAADPPTIERGESSTHNSACALADSMAGKLGFKTPPDPDQARHTCNMLAPSMNESDKAEFVRCCMKRLAAGQPSQPNQHKAKAKKDPGI